MSLTILSAVRMRKQMNGHVQVADLFQPSTEQISARCKRSKIPISLCHEGSGTPGQPPPLVSPREERSQVLMLGVCNETCQALWNPTRAFIWRCSPGEEAHSTLCLTFQVPASPELRRRCRCACPSDLVPCGGLELEARAGVGGAAPRGPSAEPAGRQPGPSRPPRAGGCRGGGQGALT